MKNTATKIFDGISMIALVIGSTAMLADIFSPFLNQQYSWFFDWFHIYSFTTLLVFMLLSGWLKKTMPIIVLLFICNVGSSQIFFKKEAKQQKLPPNEIGSLHLDLTPQIDKKIWFVIGGQLAAGFLDGSKEAYTHHHSQYKRVWKNSVPNEEAWVNKWYIDDGGTVHVGVERFPFSSTLLSWTTDEYHAYRTSVRFCDAGSALIYGLSHKKKKWYWYIADFGIGFTARSIGYHSAYSLIYK